MNNHTSCDKSYHWYVLCTFLLGIPPNSAAPFNIFHGIYVHTEMIELKHLVSLCIKKIISVFKKKLCKIYFVQNQT